MHELSIAQGIIDVVTTKAAECQATRVKEVRLLIGEASGVALDPLTFCFEMLAGMDPVLSGAHLSIQSLPHRARCRNCAREFNIPEFVARCPECAGWDTEVISGNELQVLEMEFEDSYR